MSSIVTLRGVSFEFNDRTLFENLNMSIGQGLTALVGANGVGKTTLARLLSGEIEPSAGNILRTEPVAYFAQKCGPPSVSAAEYLGDDFEWSSFTRQLLEDLDLETACSQLSGGEWMRLRLAKVPPGRFLILDEPTNDLDREGRQVVAEFLGSRAGGTLLISHDREILDLCDEVLELSSRGLAKYGGGWRSYVLERARERDRLTESLEAARRFRNEKIEEQKTKRIRQEKRNQKGAAQAGKGGQAKILLGRRKSQAQVTSGKLDVEAGLRVNKAFRDAHEAFGEIKVDPVMYADLLGQPIPAQRLVAEAIGFNIRFRHWLFSENLNFSWRGNIRLALQGANGSGKSTLLKAILGESFDVRGDLRRGGLRTLYIDQRRSSLSPDKTVLQNIQDVARLDESEIRNGLARFLFTKERVFQKVGDLSGGETLRAALARGFLAEEKPELLILDEPTNNLDLANGEFLERWVAQFKGAVIAVSHDRDFLANSGILQEYRLPDRQRL